MIAGVSIRAWDCGIPFVIALFFLPVRIHFDFDTRSKKHMAVIEKAMGVCL